MPEIEKLLSDRSNLPAGDFSKVISIKAKDGIEPPLISSNFSEENLPDDLVDSLFLPFNFLSQQKFERVEILFDSLITFVNGLNVKAF